MFGLLSGLCPAVVSDSVLLAMSCVWQGNLDLFLVVPPSPEAMAFDVNISKNGNTQFLLCMSQDSECLLYIQ